jgi:glycosyltransferase involved in cell wall biosynthesis
VIPRVVAIVAARDEAATVADTVRALRSIDGVQAVVVVDDGSRDGTGAEALASGATVLRGRRRRGKGGALEGALERVAPADVWLLADADLGSSASALGALLPPVLGERADLAIGVFPPGAGGGGLGSVKRLAGRIIRLASGLQTREPLSGQRAVTAGALAACRPLAPGFGVETAMTIDAVRGGFRVVEVPVEIDHRGTGRTLRGFWHRGRQGFDILRAGLIRAGGLR